MQEAGGRHSAPESASDPYRQCGQCLPVQKQTCQWPGLSATEQPDLPGPPPRADLKGRASESGLEVAPSPGPPPGRRGGPLHIQWTRTSPGPGVPARPCTPQPPRSPKLASTLTPYHPRRSLSLTRRYLERHTEGQSASLSAPAAGGTGRALALAGAPEAGADPAPAAIRRARPRHAGAGHDDLMDMPLGSPLPQPALI
jgi:hypothetical protein